MFSLVVKINIDHIITTLVVEMNKQPYQMDVKGSVLNKDLSKEVYMEKLPSYV